MGYAGIGNKVPYAVALAALGVSIYGLSEADVTNKTSQLYVGTHATGSKVFTVPTADNQSVCVGGQCLVARATGVDAGVQPDATVAVGCGGDACSSAASAAATFGAAINAQASNTVSFVGRDGGVAYFQAKDAGNAANVLIGGTLAGATSGMSGGSDPIAASGNVNVPLAKGAFAVGMANGRATAQTAGDDGTIPFYDSTSATGISAQSLSGLITDYGIAQHINVQTGTTYTLAATDSEAIITLTNAGAITVTVPKQSSVSISVGFRTDIVQGGAGKVTVAPEDGTVTVNSAAGNLSLLSQYAAATLIKTATNTWLLVGALGS